MDDFMKQFLAYLERIATALENGAALSPGTATTTPAGKPDTKAADDKAAADAKAKADKKAADDKAAADAKAAEAAKGPVYTLDEVRAALKEYRAIEGAPAMLEVLKVHGGKEALTEVDPKDFAAIMTAVGAAKTE